MLDVRKDAGEELDNTWYTADTHFDHERIIELCKRPFANVYEMNEKLIENWNSVVPVNGFVWHIGDFAYKSSWESVQKIRARLNGQIGLILGNHDADALECQKRFPDTFAVVTSYKVLHVSKKKELTLFHYGMRTWLHDLRGSWHLYGHSHSKLAGFGKSFDVGVDAQNYKPLSFAQVKEKMDKAPFGVHPRFENYVPEEETNGQDGKADVLRRNDVGTP